MKSTSARAGGQSLGGLRLQAQTLTLLAVGTSAAATVFGTGLALIKFHGGIWPWWFHGLSVALATGFIAVLATYLHLQEVSRREARRRAGERMSHEVCSALQILFQCTYLYPLQRSQLETEAIERIHVAVRQILPNILEMPVDIRPAPTSFLGKTGVATGTG